MIISLGVLSPSRASYLRGSTQLSRLQSAKLPDLSGYTAYHHPLVAAAS
jgi:hypothetical protein